MNIFFNWIKKCSENLNNLTRIDATNSFELKNTNRCPYYWESAGKKISHLYRNKSN